MMIDSMDEDTPFSLTMMQNLHQQHHHFTVERRGDSEKKAAVLELNVSIKDLSAVECLEMTTLLQEIGERIHHRLRESDVVLPMRRDKFVILLEDVASLANADIVARELVDIIHRPLDTMPEHIVNIGASISISFFTQLELELINFPRHKKHKIFDVKEYLHKTGDHD